MLAPHLIEQVKKIEITAKRLAADVFAGEYQSLFKGRGMEFEDVRPYIPGDDTRRIDWNVTARMAAPYVRRYQEERELTVMLMVDASASSDFGTRGRFKRELAAELAAILSIAATSNNDRVGLLMFTDRAERIVPPRKGRRHVLRIVRDLLAFEPSGTGTDIESALDAANLILKRRSIVFLISDFIAPPDSYRRSLSAAARRHDLVAFDLRDPAEREIPRMGIVALEDAETGELVWVDTDDEGWRRSYERETAALEDAKLGALNAVGADRVELETGREYVAALNDFFRRRAKKRRRRG